MTRVIVAFIAACLVMPASPTHAAFPGRNGEIAYERNGNIMVRKPNGNRRLLIPDAQDPRWSPDGRRIVYVEFATGVIYVANADGTRRRKIGPGHAPSWSPDSRKLVFHRNSAATNGMEIFVASADNTGVRRLTSGGGRDSLYPVWSPNGRRIAFVRYVDFYSEVFVMRRDGSRVRRITGIKGDTYHLDWSPDSRYLLRTHIDHERYCTQELYPGTNRHFDIYKLDVDGDHEQRLRRCAALANAVFSPNGRKIVLGPDWAVFRFRRRGEPRSGLYVMNTDGTNLRRLTFDDGHHPNWRPRR